MRAVTVTTLLLMLAAVPPAAAAQEAVPAPSPWYLQARAGVYVPTFDRDSFPDSGLDIELTAGRTIAPKVALELAVGSSEITSAHLLYVDAVGTGIPSRTTLRINPVTFSAKGIFTFGRASAFVLAGVGLYFVDGDTKYDEPQQPDPGGRIFYRRGVSDYFRPGVHAGGGAALRLSRHFDLGVDVRYFVVSAKFEAGDPTGTSTTPTVEKDHRIDGVRASVGLAYRF